MVFMQQGRVHEMVEPEEVFFNSKTPEQQQFPGMIQEGERIDGSAPDKFHSRFRYFVYAISHAGVIKRSFIGYSFP
ncbi:hypothetical protein [Polaromonas sp.]|uniref:hypothetical protein n=1 Tax=Polaromonas sp. TaxID=1869339 RepID=UPI00352650F6